MLCEHHFSFHLSKDLVGGVGVRRDAVNRKGKSSVSKGETLPTRLSTTDKEIDKNWDLRRSNKDDNLRNLIKLISLRERLWLDQTQIFLPHYTNGVVRIIRLLIVKSTVEEELVHLQEKLHLF